MNVFFYRLANLNAEKYEKIRHSMINEQVNLLDSFEVSNSSTSNTEGVFIKKKSKFLTITNQSGEIQTVEHISYERKNFYIDLDQKTLTIWNAGRSVKSLINNLSNASNYSLSFERLTLDFKTLEALLEESFKEKSTLTSLTQPICLEGQTKARIELSSENKGVHADSYGKLLRSTSKLRIAKKTYRLFDGYSSSKLTVSHSGNIKIDGDSVLVELLRSNLNQISLTV